MPAPTAQDRENARRRYVRALLSVYAGASDDARTYGPAWYGAAHAAAAQLGERYGFTTAQAAGAIAALSPRVHWSENLSDADAVLAWAEDSRAGTGPYVPHWALGCSAFSANVAKAAECLGVDDPLTVLNGPKQRAFYHNIIGETDCVTVDVWATRAATRGAQNGPRGKREYADISSAYRRAAARVGQTPRDFQAAVWIAARGAAL